MSPDDMTDAEVDLYYCVGCEGDRRDPWHFGCTVCGDCTCENTC